MRTPTTQRRYTHPIMGLRQFQSTVFVSSFTPRISPHTQSFTTSPTNRPFIFHKPNRRSRVISPVATSTPAQPTEETEIDKKRRDVTRLFTLFSRLAVPYWKSSSDARKDLASVVALTFLQSGVSVLFSYISRDFWTALNTKNADLFFHQAGLFFIALVAFTPIVVYYQYFRDMTALKWRDWLTQRVLGQYTSHRNFYLLEADTVVDNPDQRIAQDLNSFTTESLAFSLTLLVSAIDMVSFSAILFSIYPLLFGILLLYASTGTYLTAVVGKRLIGLNYQQLVKEADLRYGLIRMRENAESIAFFRGEDREKSEMVRRLTQTVDNMKDVIQLRRQLGFLQTGYKYAVQVLPAICVAPKYFAGLIELGSVTQSFSAFSHILGDLSLVVNRFDSLSQFGAGIDRLAQFVTALERNIDAEQRMFNTEEEDVKVEDGILTQVIPGRNRELSIQNLTVLTPLATAPRRLIEDLNITLTPGTRLLVVGPSGTGKSSLLRAIAGLWTNGSGIISRPGQDGMFFLPQKPYCTLGSLRDNMLYPRDGAHITDISDATLEKVLEQVQLEQLPQRMGGLDAVADWADVLSLGEQQRLQFARLLLCGANVVIIDEGTSALSVAAEKVMYELLRRSGKTVISVGHRPTLLDYHDSVLRLRPDGTWEMEQVKQTKRQGVVATNM